MSLPDTTVALGGSGRCFTPLKAFLIISLGVEVKETQGAHGGSHSVLCFVRNCE